MTVYVYDENGNCEVNGAFVSGYNSETFTFPASSGQHFYFDAFGNENGNEYSLDFWPTKQQGGIFFGGDTPFYSDNWDGDGGALCTPIVQVTALSLAKGGTLHDLLIRDVATGLQSSGDYSVTNLQFVQCQTAAFESDNASLYAGNVLISDSSVAFSGQNFSVQSEQLTYDGSGNVAYDSTFGNSSIALTNALITGPISWGNTAVYSDSSVMMMPSGHGVYQVTGAGSYYLGNNSPSFYGTPNISPALRAVLSRTTTYPPIVYTDTAFNNNVEFAPQAPRDAGTDPIIGYHYCPLDYCFGGVTANGNLTFDAGTAVGWFETSDGTGYGIALGNHTTNIFEGTVTAPCIFARYSTVQEGGNGNWTRKGWLAGISTATDPSFAEIDAHFTDCYALSSDPNYFRDFYGQLNVHASHSEFHSGTMAGFWLGQFLTNCLFDHLSQIGSQQRSAGLFWRDCTMYGGSLIINHSVDCCWPVWIENCVFDGSSVSMDDNSGGDSKITYCNFNAFVNGAQRLAVEGSQDIVITTPYMWQTGPLGNFYLPANSRLIDAGSLPAGSLGLYNFTTQTSQAEECNSLVDIGYHYIALDQWGNVLDSDSDGFADWWEMQYFGHLGVDPSADPDGDGLSNLAEYQDGTNPLQPDNARLAYWKFDDPPDWFDEQGLQPSIATGINVVPSWAGDAVEITSGMAAALGYPGTRNDGSLVATLPIGTIRFWFKPSWSLGPDSLRLFEIGKQSVDATYGWFAITVGNDGTTTLLKFVSEANGVHTDNLVRSVNFNANTWYQIVLTYTPTSSSFYLNGQLLGTAGAGLANVLSQSVLKQGFRLGCSWDGSHQAEGTFDELETFNYVLSAADILSNYQTLANRDSDGDGVTDIVENERGTNPNGVDSDCDGLPDGWEVAHGLNPLDPNDATSDNLNAYINSAASGLDNTFGHVDSASSLINIDFSTGSISPVVGPEVVGHTKNDTWNVFTPFTDNDVLHGVALKDCSGNPTTTTVYAYFGPCVSAFYDYSTIDWASEWAPSTVYKEELEGGLPNLCIGGPYLNYQWFYDDGLTELSFPEYIQFMSAFDGLGYYFDSWAAEYGDDLQSLTCIDINCYLDPFLGSENLPWTPPLDNPLMYMPGDGWTWAFPGSLGSSIYQPGLFYQFFPGAKRKMLISNPPGGPDFGVYLYYSCSGNVAPPKINGVTATAMTTSDGVKYWYCHATLTVVYAPSTFQECLASPRPFWIPTCSALEIDSLDENIDLLGMQIVSFSDGAKPKLQAIPGLQSAYLAWEPSGLATSYDIYRADGASPSTWVKVGSTQGVTFTDQNLTAGATYTYKIQNMNGGGGVYSDPVSVVPWGCVPTISGPTSVTITYGQNATFSVQLTGGSGPIHYQWRRHFNGATVNVGTDSSSYTEVEPPVSESGATFDVIITAGGVSQTSVQARLIINRAALVVVADDQTRPKGEPNHPLAYSVRGLAPGDTVATVFTGQPLLSTTAQTSSDIGTYPITIVQNTFICVNNNYNKTVTFQNGTLTIVNTASGSPGTDFWIAFLHLARYSDSDPFGLAPGEVQFIGISGSPGTQGVVSVPGLGFSTSFSIPASGVVYVTNDVSVMVTDDDQVQNKGIHITASQPVSVCGMSLVPFASEGFLGFPTLMLGTHYCIMSYQIHGGYPPSSPDAVIVATADNTVVKITPSPTANLLGHEGPSPYQITLNQGQTYEMSSATGDKDISGTFVDASMPVAVFGGNYITDMPRSLYAANPLVEEQLPVEDWGKQALGVPLATRGNGDTYRILAAEDNTEIKINGQIVTTLEAGQVYENIINGPVEFEGSGPIQVAQFSNSGDFDNSLGDPFEMLLLPTGRYLTTYNVIVPGGFTSDFINLTLEKGAIPTTTIDGSPVDQNKLVSIGSSGYYGGQFLVAAGSHTVNSTRPVGVEVYGYSMYDGYGYIGGLTNFVFVAVPDVFSISLNTPKELDVLANDVFASRLDTVLTVTTGPTHGTFKINSANNIVYTPANGYSGDDTLTYRIQESGRTSSAAVTLWINNHAPTANDDTFELCPRETDATLDVLKNDTDPDGDALSIQSISTPNRGAAGEQGNKIVFHRVGGNVDDTFTYTITDGRGGISAPATVNIKASLLKARDYGVPQTLALGQSISIPVLQIASCESGRTMTVVDVSKPKCGHATIDANHTSIIYTAGTVRGEDSFICTVSDGFCTDVATVTIQVEGPPVILQQPQSQTVNEGDGVWFSVQASGYGTLRYDWYINGVYYISGSPIIYTPKVGLEQAGTFYVIVSDDFGSVKSDEAVLTVNAVPPGDTVANEDIFEVQKNSQINTLNVLANDTDSDGYGLVVKAIQPLQGTTGTTAISQDGKSVIYTPQTDFSGVDSFQYSINNGHNRSSQMVTVLVCVNATGHNITAQDVTVDLSDGVFTTTFNVLPAGSGLSLNRISKPSMGTADFGANPGDITYNRDPSKIGTDVFNYALSDGSGGYAVAKIIVRQPWNAGLQAMPGYHQVYLDWQDDPDSTDFDLYYTLNQTAPCSTPADLAAYWTLDPAATGLTLTRYWHQNLTPGTPYRYVVVGHPYFSPSSIKISQPVSATPLDTGAPATYIFSPQASPYDGMVLVEWKVPKLNSTDPDVINQTEWQFYLERKLASAGDETYQALTDPGFGLAYLDSDVQDGVSYVYRVSAFHYTGSSCYRVQALAALKGDAGGSTTITPTSANGLTLLDPVAGNGYVELAWSPIRANEFTVTHSLNPSGPFETLAVLDPPNAFQNPQNTFRHVGAANGVTHYYQIIARPPVQGSPNILSAIKSAIPSATLQPLPPVIFQAQLIPHDSLVGSQDRILLTWTPALGATGYQVFLKSQNGLIPLSGYGGVGVSCFCSVPAGTADGISFTFAVRSVSSSGLVSDTAETTIVYQTPADPPNAGPDAIVLKIGDQLGSGTTLEITAPTNLVLTADVNVPDVEQVDFYAFRYSDGTQQHIGTASWPGPYQVTWFHVPGGVSTITATALTKGSSGTAPAQSVSTTANIDVTVKAQLAAYNAAETDLQLPAVGIPISLSRTYSSRNVTQSDSDLAIGWTANWKASSLKLSASLGSGWKGVEQNGFAQKLYYIGEEDMHLVTVTLPTGETLMFAPQLIYNPYTEPKYYDPSTLDITIDMAFEGFTQNQGTLQCNDLNEIDGMTLSSDSCIFLDDEWNCDDFQLDIVPASFTYISPDQTQYLFAQPVGGDGLTWLLTRITDANGNSLTYHYGNSDPQSPDYTSNPLAVGQLISIMHSSGRNIRLDYGNGTFDSNPTKEVKVFDTIGGTIPVLIYELKEIQQNSQVVDQLVAVRHTVTRDGSHENDTRYVYGDSQYDHNRITEVYDARGVRTLKNSYMNDDGDLLEQVDTLGATTDYDYNPGTGDLTVHRTAGGVTRTMQVTHDPSGAISGITEPANGTDPGSKAVQNTYDDRGRVTVQTDAQGNKKYFSYDDQDRLTGQTDANGNSTYTSLNDMGQPITSVDANENQTSYAYEGANLSYIEEPGGSSTDFTHGSASSGSLVANGLVMSQTQTATLMPYQIVTSYAYKQIGVVGDLVSETIDEEQDGSQITVPITTTYEYDENGNRTAEIKSRTVTGGGTEYIRTEYSYDALNRVTDTDVRTSSSANDPGDLVPNSQSHITYNELGKQVTSTDGYNRVTTSVYDFAGRLIETIAPDGSVLRTTYNADGKVDFSQDRAKPFGDITTAPATRNTYDPSGRIVRIDRYDTVTLQKKPATTPPTEPFDYISRPGSDPQFKMVFSSLGNILSTTRTFYDAVGRVQYTVDARSNVTERVYDPAGRLTATKLYTTYFFDPTQIGDAVPKPPNGFPYEQTSYTYDRNGNQLTVTDALGHTTTSIFDSGNRVVQVQFPATAGNGVSTKRTEYDGLGRKVAETDEANVATSFTYDFRSLLTSVTLAIGTPQEAKTTYQYDEVGNQVGQTDANNHTTTFQYGALGHRTVRTLPDASSESVAYAAVSDPVDSNIKVLQQTITDFNQRTTILTQDRMGRLANKQLPAITHDVGGSTVIDFPATTVTYDYDTNGQVARVVQSGGVNRTVRQAFDAKGRLRVKDSPEGTLTYTYDDGSDLITQISARYVYTGWPANPPYQFENLTLSTVDTTQAEWNYRYDSRGRLQKVNPDSDAVTALADASYGYDNVGNLQILSLRNGLTTTYTYNERNWLRMLQTTANGTAVAQFDYDQAEMGGAAWPDNRRLSPVGQRRRVVESFNGISRLVDYDYDSLRRLTKENYVGNGSDDFNVRYDTVTAGSTTEGFDFAGNRRSRTVSGPGANNLIALGLTTYNDTQGDSHQFDSRDRLLGANAASPSYDYDANG